ncbi:MAG: hypothetical protein R6V12_09705 [Candidatus Hydrogenedentota bacterium]
MTWIPDPESEDSVTIVVTTPSAADPFHFEPEVIVVAGRIVLLDHEDRSLVGPVEPAGEKTIH